MLRRRALWLLAAAMVVVGCERSPDDVDGVAVRYYSPPYPPPNAFTWSIEATRDGELRFEKRYLGRGEAGSEALEFPPDLALKIPFRDDVEARVLGAAISLRSTRSNRVGGSRMEATFHTPDGEFSGTPTNPEAWFGIADELAAAASAEVAGAAAAPDAP